MSYDKNILGTKNNKNYFELLNTGKLNKNNNNLMTLNNNNNNKSEDKKCIENKYKKQLNIGSLFSTLENTVTSKQNENEEDNSINKENMNINITSKKPVMPKDEDMAFLYEIFFKNQGQTDKYYIKGRKSETLDLNSSNRNDYNNNNYDFSSIKKYLIKLQKKFKINENLVIENKPSTKIIDNLPLQQLEDLINRYILIIHLLIRCCKFNEAKKLFLLLLKENLNSINDIDNQINLNYTERNRKINKSKAIPKSAYQLLKIYSLIIRYSRLFNLNKYRNKFLIKYIKMQLLNYKIFLIKAKNRGFSMEINNQIKYIFSYCFHNISYYCIQNYMPINIPIIFNSSIISLYPNTDYYCLEEREKNFLIKTLYNQGVLYYINNNIEESLLNLKQSKAKIISLGDAYFDFRNKIIGKILFRKSKENSVDLVNHFKKDSISENNMNISENINYNRKDNIRRTTDNNKHGKSIISIIFDNIDFSGRKHSNISTDNKTQKKDSKYEKIILQIKSNLKKDKISINDIEMLLIFGKENMLLNDDTFSFEKNFALFGRSKERFNSYKNNNQKNPKGARGSHIDFHTSINIRNFNIPDRFKNPLLRNIELLLCLIELSKKNYEASYDHVLKVLYLLIVLKLGNNNNEYDKDFFNHQKFEIDKYFEMIGKAYEMFIKKEKLIKKKSSELIFNFNEIKENPKLINFDQNTINLFHK